MSNQIEQRELNMNEMILVPIQIQNSFIILLKFNNFIKNQFIYFIYHDVCQERIPREKNCFKQLKK